MLRKSCDIILLVSSMKNENEWEQGNRGEYAENPRDTAVFRG